MDTHELIQQWKQPGARHEETVEHPAGGIVLQQVGRLARRSDLLAARVGLHLTDVIPTYTMTTPGNAEAAA